jgi:Helix-turn-helix domain
VTTDVAAAALRRSPRHVHEYICRGLLAAKTEGEGVGKRWLVSIDSLNTLLDEAGHTTGTRRRRGRLSHCSRQAAASGWMRTRSRS